MNDQIDQIATMLAHFVCADSGDDATSFGRHQTKQISTEHDAGVRLRFAPLEPSLAYTAQVNGEREFAMDAALLLQTPQDLLGNLTEIALVSGDTVKWSAFKKLTKRPPGVWVASPGADLYEYHSRFIRANGSSDYRKRVAAISKTGRPVRVIIEGTKNQGGVSDGVFLVLAASMVEDSVRPGAFQATVRERAGLIFPVPQGEHLDVFKLRDGPMVGDRRKSLLHWVAKHSRRTTGGLTVVKEHLRGVHQFEIDGFSVTLKGAA
ncbi:MAG: hypothetical protein K2Y15_04880 [Burkholderiaceae bacterium]|nr:hypothetical protein [Burkholderiaceae bacterium]